MGSKPEETMEAKAEREIGNTDMTRGTALFLTLGFLLVILTVPCLEPRGYLKMFGMVSPSGSRDAGWSTGFGLLPSVEEIGAAEEELEEESLLVDLLLPPLQRMLLGLGAGNEQAYPGREGWLFYRPDVAYLTGPGFLSKGHLRRRRFSGSETEGPIEPDPRPALLAFKKSLEERGIELMLLPTPVKPMIYPEKFASEIEGSPFGSGRIDNPSWDRLRNDLIKGGFQIADATSWLLEEKSATSEPLYLRTDTHWTPKGLEIVAQKLARKVEARLGKSKEKSEPAFAREETVVVTRTGDVAEMLGLDAQGEEVEVRRVIETDRGNEARKAPAEVLLLGDSFSNIYSLEEMGWGKEGGLSERLSFHLQRPVQSLLRNDDGSYATRLELLREVERGNGILDGKKVLIYQFAVREFLFGDWRTLPLGATPRESGSGTPAALEIAEVVEATVLDRSAVPSPGEVPYKDFVMALRLGELAPPASISDQEVVAFCWGMRDRVRTPLSRLKIGDRVRLSLREWEQAEREFGGFNRGELRDEESWRLPTYWGVVPGKDESEVSGKGLRERLVARKEERPALERSAETPDPQIEGDRGERDPSEGESVTVRTGSFREIFNGFLEEAGGGEIAPVIPGSDGWLFFGPEIRHVWTGAFFGADTLRYGRASDPERRDPLPTMLDLYRQLESRDIELILVPVPAKSVVYGDRLPGIEPATLANARKIRENRFADFKEPLEAAGVFVLDLVGELEAEREPSGQDLYCRQDTHWSPAACEKVAGRLAAHIADRDWIAEVPKRDYVIRDKTFEIVGDLATRLTPPQTTKEEITARFVLEDGESGPRPPSPWRESPVLLLGDSHTLVFHAGGDLLASGCGLFDHLAYALGFPSDLVGVRGSGSTAARLNLFRRRDELRGKKVVIWCFSVREFTESSDGWRKVPLIR